MDDPEDPRVTIALWKLSVLGPLISVRLEHGDRLALLIEAAERTHQRPDGRLVRLSARTLEAWLNAELMLMRGESSHRVENQA